MWFGWLVVCWYHVLYVVGTEFRLSCLAVLVVAENENQYLILPTALATSYVIAYIATSSLILAN